MSAPRRPPRRHVDGVLLLDKPSGLTSNGALRRVKRLYNAEKAGHTGTLDPLASGLLPHLLRRGDAIRAVPAGCAQALRRDGSLRHHDDDAGCRR